MSASPGASDRKSYDLYIRPGERRLVWSFSDQGVSLSDDTIAWVADGWTSQAALRDIVEVHLQLGYVEDNAVGSCRLRFADGSALSVVSSNKRGFEDATQDQLYVAFVHDLHARLAAQRDAHPSFTAGLSEGRYRFGFFIGIIAVLFFIVTPIVLLLVTRDWKAALFTYTGVVLLWPLYKVMQANAPRSYDPRHVPPELMPVPLNLPPKVDPILLDSID